MNGLVNINKPAGMSSRQVVDRVAALAKTRRVGHTGTLDPLAEGVLVVCLGTATRLAEYVQRMVKVYRAEFMLACRSETDDIETQIEVVADAVMPTRETIEAAAREWTGEVRQRPPAYSAIKVKGQRAYRLARAGRKVEIPERTVHIERIELVAYDPPKLELEITCHAGTYIRSLGRDLAATAGTCAVMSRLTRTAVGTFSLQQAVPLPELKDRADVLRALLPLRAAVAELPQWELTEDQLAKIEHGQSVALESAVNTSGTLGQGANTEVAALDEAGNLRAVLVCRRDGWGPKKVFPIGPTIDSRPETWRTRRCTPD